MASNMTVFPVSLARTVAQAAASAAVGGKGAAGCVAVSTAIGAPWRLRIIGPSGIVVDAVYQSALPVSGGSITLPGYTTLLSLISASISAGWKVRIGRADDSAYVEGAVGAASSSAPFRLTANPSTSKGFAVGQVVLQFDPAIDAQSGDGPHTLAAEYARAMSDLNDFAPGNLQDTTWPSSAQFTESPWGSNVDQMVTSGSTPTGPQEGRVLPVGATRVLGWCWFMPRKRFLAVLGNWRIEFGYVQMANRIDSLSNAWTKHFGPITPDPAYGFVLADGTLPLSGNIADSANTAVIRPFENNSPLRARIESSQTVSIANAGVQANWFQVEINVPDGRPEVSNLPASVTSDRCKAFAGCFWARIIKDNPSGPEIPADLEIGALMGLDCYSPTDRVGNPGWGRLRRLTTEWKPIVMAFVRDPADERYPMSRGQIAQWLAANPPPFVGPA